MPTTSSEPNCRACSIAPAWPCILNQISPSRILKVTNHDERSPSIHRPRSYPPALLAQLPQVVRLLLTPYRRTVFYCRCLNYNFEFYEPSRDSMEGPEGFTPHRHREKYSVHDGVFSSLIRGFNAVAQGQPGTRLPYHHPWIWFHAIRETWGRGLWE
jgi:hypothetical protein